MNLEPSQAPLAQATPQGWSRKTKSKNSPEETQNPRRDSEKTERYHTAKTITHVVSPCFLGVSSWVWSLSSGEFLGRSSTRLGEGGDAVTVDGEAGLALDLVAVPVGKPLVTAQNVVLTPRERRKTKFFRSCFPWGLSLDSEQCLLKI